MATVPWLGSQIEFPAAESALSEPNGLLAIGGDLSPQRLVAAYRQGIFPWFDDDQPILWWSPDPRAVLFPKQIAISRSLKKCINRQQFTVTADQRFTAVVTHCASVPRNGQNGTWITDEMLAAYQQLFQLGIAHSIEVWENQQLVGGLYGVAIGKVFFGESMFSLATNASKVGFAHLAQQLQQWGYALIDCQVSSPHLLSLGAEEIRRSQFNRLLADNIDASGCSDWPGNWAKATIQ
jgi:leucyl/phenylalanyl-tRNA--protein transferase